MKIIVEEEIIDVVETVNYIELIKETNESSYLVGKNDDPFYVCDLSDIVKKHALWVQRFPRISPFYAVKCNNSPLVLKLLATLGTGFDCASRGEITQIMSFGVCPSRIIYANPCKQLSHIKYAESEGVSLMTFDSQAELTKIFHVHPRARLIIRIATETTKARCQLGLKFGVAVNDIKPLLRYAYSLGLDVVGVSFHVGSGCFDASAYKSAIQRAYTVFSMAESMGHPMSILDIGGGFPGNLFDSDNGDLFDEVCYMINSSLDEYFPDSSNVSVIAEPGRFYVSSAFQLSCTVTSCRESSKVSENGLNEKLMNYFLNDGVYGSFNCTIFDHYIGQYYLLNVHEDRYHENFETVFWGPTCDSMDKILDGITCQKIDVGSRVVFRDMGAYTMCAGSTFNGFERPYVRWVIDREQWIAISSLLEGTAVIEEIESGDLVLISAGVTESSGD